MPQTELQKQLTSIGQTDKLLTFNDLQRMVLLWRLYRSTAGVVFSLGQWFHGFMPTCIEQLADLSNASNLSAEIGLEQYNSITDIIKQRNARNSDRTQNPNGTASLIFTRLQEVSKTHKTLIEERQAEIERKKAEEKARLEKLLAEKQAYYDDSEKRYQAIKGQSAETILADFFPEHNTKPTTMDEVNLRFQHVMRLSKNAFFAVVRAKLDNIKVEKQKTGQKFEFKDAYCHINLLEYLTPDSLDEATIQQHFAQLYQLKTSGKLLSAISKHGVYIARLDQFKNEKMFVNMMRDAVVEAFRFSIAIGYAHNELYHIYSFMLPNTCCTNEKMRQLLGWSKRVETNGLKASPLVEFMCGATNEARTEELQRNATWRQSDFINFIDRKYHNKVVIDEQGKEQKITKEYLKEVDDEWSMFPDP